ncbi:hypothetical protein KR067_009929 [Drosophila pandora]|nr:hypothetical protein KR067_009929 [Drosophila pandora]
MAHNATMSRKSKALRTDLPSIYHQQPQTQPQDDMGPPREKISKLNASRDVHHLRRCMTTKHCVVDCSSKNSKVIVHDLNRMDVDQHIDLGHAAKHTFRTMGGGGGAAAAAAAISAAAASGSQKYQSKVSLSKEASKTTRSSIATSSVKKQPASPAKDFRDLKVSKDVKEIKEFKELREAREHKELKPHKDKEIKEVKSPKGNHTHRHPRHTTANRTKTYFDKYLKFAFDLSTPEGVKQLEDHFFPNPQPGDQNTLAPGDISQSAESKGN